MTHFAAFFAVLLAYCLCCTTTMMASNPEQWTGATTPATQIGTVPKFANLNVQGDRRANVMQFPKFILLNVQKTGRWNPGDLKQAQEFGHMRRRFFQKEAPPKSAD